MDYNRALGTRKPSLIRDKTFQFKTPLQNEEKQPMIAYIDLDNPSVKSQIGLVYLKPVVNYSVTLYFHPDGNKVDNAGPGGCLLKPPEDSR